MDHIEHIISRYWGFSDFRPLQRDAMNSVIKGQDSLVVMPTGGGKSLCFQAPALAVAGMAVVVSPLISLMKDQVDFLRTCGVDAACINSSLNGLEKRKVDEDIRGGRLKLLYVAPERLATDNFIQYLRKVDISFFAIDEAHCISHWGHDFRPHYRQMSLLKENFDGIPIHAYTATATAPVRDDICKQLGLVDPAIYVGDFDRPNLVYSVERQTDRFKQVLDIVERHTSEAGIVYCQSRKKVEAMAEHLENAGHSARPYHAGMDDVARKRNQDSFARDETDILVATVAFGMGIDKSNVRFVIHSGMPKSLEHYQQESGRAGRDGLEAECVLLHSAADSGFWRRLLAELNDEAYSAAISKLNDICDYAARIQCRHKSLVEYFGQTFLKKNCNACDSCMGTVDFLDDSLAISQNIVQGVVSLGEIAGPSYTTLVLCGSSEERVVAKGHDKLPVWGSLSSYSRKEVRDWVEQLAGQGFLEKQGEYSILCATEKGELVLAGEESPRLLKPAPQKAKKTRKHPEKTWEGVDRDLAEVLRKTRLGLAQERAVPAYIIFGDATLRDMAIKKPRTLQELLGVQGIGEKKCHDFGTLFLQTIESYLNHESDLGPAPTEGAHDEKRRTIFERYSDGMSSSEVAVSTGISITQAVKILHEYLREHDIVDASPWVPDDKFRAVAEAVEVVGSGRIKAIYEYLDGAIDEGAINVALVCLRNIDRSG